MSQLMDSGRLDTRHWSTIIDTTDLILNSLSLLLVDIRHCELTKNATFFSSRRRIMNSISGVDTGTFSTLNT